jgi:tRNA(Ile2) C34 agmatinyltransferase TiaS
MRRRRTAKAKVARVATVTVDQAVACPNCGNPMQLSETWTFACKLCGREVTAEEASKALEPGGV